MMRRLLFTLGFLVAFTGVVEAQQEILRSDGRRTQVDTYLRALKTLHLPYGPTPTFDGGLQKEGSIFYNTTDSSLYVWDGTAWVQVAPDTDLSNYYTKSQTDSLLTYYATVQELNDGLALKVDKTTTINGYALSGNITLTAADVGALTKALADTYYKDINWVPAWEEITNKPSAFPPGPHTHPISQVVGLQDALDAKQATITGAASTITSADLTSDRALISSSTGKVAVSEVTSEELGYVSGVTSGVQGQIDNKVDKSTTITNTGGINIGGSLASGNVSLGLNETYLNNRYLRKDRNDGNDDYTLSVGKLVGDTVNASRLELVSLATTSENEYLVVDALGVVSKRTIDQMTFDVSNSGGTTQFSVGDQDQLRFQGTGDTQISFNAATKTIVINSVPGQGTGGVVTSVFGRDGGVVAEAGDYNTDLVTEGSNLYFTDGRVRSTELTGLTLSTSPITATDNVLQALGKAQGQINTRAASSRELEVSGTAGRVIVSGGAQDLTQNREWVVDLVASGVSVGTYPKVTVDTYGRVTAGASLVSADIPNLPAGKITSGTFNLARLATGTAAAGHYIDGGTGAWTPLPSTDLTNYYTKTETDDLLDGKYDIPTGTTGQYVRGDGSLAAFPTIPQGTVTSVGISVPSDLLSVTGSPVTSSGTFNVTLPNRAANLVFAGPATGSAASPAFRSLVQNDIPALAISKITGLQDALDGKEGAFSKGSLVAGDGVTLTGTLSNRLVGAGNVTISADIEEANLIAGDGISITGVYPDKTITNTAPNATHTGDVTGAEELTIANGVVTNAKLANVPTGTIKGRVTAGSGSPEDLTPAQVRALINVANGATANQTDAFLLNRANHTGEQAISTITGLATELGGKESLSNKTSNFNTLNNILYPTTQAVADYVSSQIPVAQELTTPGLGQIGITGGNVVGVTGMVGRNDSWDNLTRGSAGYFNYSPTGGPPGSVYSGIVIPHGSNPNYGTSLAFRNNRGFLQTLENGVLNPWVEIATLDKTVNMSGNQTGIAGNKDFDGQINFNNGVNRFGLGTSPASNVELFLGSTEGGKWSIRRRQNNNNFEINKWDSGAFVANYLAISHATGAISLPSLSGTGNGIVGVTSSGGLTRRPESDVIQTLSLGSTAGNIAISGGNSVNLRSLFTDNSAGLTDPRPRGFYSVQVATNPSEKGFPGLGSAIVSKYVTDNNASSVGAFAIHKNQANDGKLYFNVGTTVGNWNGWQVFASEEWATGYIGDNTIGLNVNTGGVTSNAPSHDFATPPTRSTIFHADVGSINRPPGAPGVNISSNYYTNNGNAFQQVMGISTVNNDSWFYRNKSGETVGSWFRVASREWVNSEGFLKSADIGNGELTLATGAGLQGTASFTANQSGNATFTVEAASGYAIPTTTKQSDWDAAYAYSEIGHIPLDQKGAVNGVATLNAGGVIPWEQLPTSNPYKGTWDASTNTPSIADGTGTAGDYYRVTEPGTQDLGSGNITFAIGDDVIYNGSIWQRVPGGNVATNLGIGDHDGTSLEITNSNGTGITLPAATTLEAGLMTASDKIKLNGIEAGATANQTDAYLLDRTNHTGNQAISTITGLQDALDGKQDTLISGVTIKTVGGQSLLGTGDIEIVTATPPLQEVLDAGNISSKGVRFIGIDEEVDLTPNSLTIGGFSGAVFLMTTDDHGNPVNQISTAGAQLSSLIISGEGSISTAPTMNNHIANKLYVDNAVGSIPATSWGTIPGDIEDQTDLMAILNNKIAVGSNITLLNNNAGYIVGGIGADEVRTNAQLDERYIQTELDPTVPQYVKDIASEDISNWNSKISSVTGGTGVTVDATDPYNPIINATAQSLTITGDATGSGTGTIELTLADDSVKTQHLADTAVTTGKIADNAVTLDKVQEIGRGKLLGLGGGGTNTWVAYTPSPGIYVGEWRPNFLPGVGFYVSYQNSLYEVIGYRDINDPPPPEDTENFELYHSNFRVFNYGTTYTPGMLVASGLSTSNYYTTSAPITGIAPTDTPVNTPASPEEITVGSGLILTPGGVLQATGQASIAGLLQAGANIAISGVGTAASPYVISSTGGGSGSSSFSGLTDVNISGISNGQTVVYQSGTMLPADLPDPYTLPIASAGTLGGVRIGSGLSIDGSGILSATGVTPSVFTRSVDGLVPAPGGSGTTRYLREDGTWAAPSGSGGGITALTGDVLASGTGSVAATIANGAVSNTKMANMPANTFKGRIGSNGSPQDLGAYASNKILNTSIELSTGVSNPDHNKNYMDLSSGGNFILTDVYLGMEYQLELKNVGGSDITISFIAVDNYDVVFPDGVDSTIPVGKTAVFSFSVFRSGTIRATKVIYSN